ncbi:MAG: pyridoxamine 5'-phosphate oxidase family protein [Actinobacteria bacterium]|nr:pyridoxamine 5'-phosphate oxidase family protein [Actinomycetota bacterium]
MDASGGGDQVRAEVPAEPAGGLIEELDETECWALLGSQQVGRLAVSTEEGPAIFPVNYLTDGEAIVFRTDPGTKLLNASLSRVAFEVDKIDEERMEGVSVVVEGDGYDITDAADERSVRMRSLPCRPWVGEPGHLSHWVLVNPRSITGRRLVAAAG